MCNEQPADDSTDSEPRPSETREGAIIRAYVEENLASDRVVYDEGVPILEVDGIGIVYADQVEAALKAVMERGGVRVRSEGVSEPYPVCSEGCGSPAVVRGLDVDGDEVFSGVPFCSECFTPASEVELPDEADRQVVLSVHRDSLIVTPADTVVQSGEETVIQHGPGEESRVVLG